MMRPIGTLKIFTPEQANATLPLVKLIVADIVALSNELMERRERLESMRDRAGQLSNSSDGDEVADIELRSSEDVQQLDTLVRELLELGVEPKVLTEGLVDFPAMIDGKIVNLCWKYGEDKIEFWHTLDDGFAGRKPIAGFQFQSSDAP